MRAICGCPNAVARSSSMNSGRLPRPTAPLRPSGVAQVSSGGMSGTIASNRIASTSRTAARGFGYGCSFGSITSVRTPCAPSSEASTPPTGPSPAMTTSTSRASSYCAIGEPPSIAVRPSSQDKYRVAGRPPQDDRGAMRVTFQRVPDHRWGHALIERGRSRGAPARRPDHLRDPDDLVHYTVEDAMDLSDGL